MKAQNLITTLVIATTLQLGGLRLNAQTTASQNTATEPGDEAIKAGNRIVSPPLQISSVSPTTLLSDALKAPGIGIKARGWDDKKNRYVAITTFNYPIKEPVTAAKLADALNMANLGIYMQAFQQFCSFLGERTEFEASLAVPESPVGRAFFDAQADINIEVENIAKELEAARAKLRSAQATIDRASASEAEERVKLENMIAAKEHEVKQLNQKAQYGPNTLDRINVAMDAIVKKLDTNYNSSTYATAKKEAANTGERDLGSLKTQKAATASQDLAEAKNNYEALQSRIQQLAKRVKGKTEEARSLHTNYQEQWLKKQHNWSADYSIVGLTPIKYFYGLVKDGKGNARLEVAGAFAWSPALERATRAILHTADDRLSDSERLQSSAYLERFPKSEALTKPGDMSLEDWLDSQKDHMDTFGPARWYVDDDGTRYFLGVAYAPVGRNAVSMNINLQKVWRDAKANLGLCLNVKVQSQGTKSDSAIIGSREDSDEATAEVLNTFASAITAKHKGLDIASEAGDPGTFTLSLEGGNGQSEQIRWYAVKVSEKAIRAAYAAVLTQADSAARANDEMYRRIGDRKAANDHVMESEQNTAKINEAYAKTKGQLETPTQSSSSRASEPAVVGKPSTNTQTQGTIQPFIKGDTRKVPDDF